MFKVGSRVSAAWYSNPTEWFPGKVTRVVGDGTFDVVTDEGDVLLGLPGKPEYMVAASTPAATNSDPNGSACQVCLQVLFEGDADIYMCEKCKGCGHFECLGLERPPAEDEDYYCPRCKYGKVPVGDYRCEYCNKVGPNYSPMIPVKGSGLKRWGHMACVEWIADLSRTENLEIVENIDPERRKLICEYCNVKVGLPIQCPVKDCIAQFHPLCGRQHGLLSYCGVQEVVNDKGKGEYFTVNYMYCEKHTRFIQLKGLSATNLTAINKAIKAELSSRIAEASAKSRKAVATQPAKASKKRPAAPDLGKDADHIVASDEEFASSEDEDGGTASGVPPGKGTVGGAGSNPDTRLQPAFLTKPIVPSPFVEVSSPSIPRKKQKSAEAVKPAPRPALPLRKAKPPYKSVKGVLLEANGTVLDESALQLHNGPINAVMRAAMRCSNPNDKSKDVAFAANDDEDADGKMLFHGKFAKAGVGKGALKSLLNMYNSVSELKDDEYGSGNESEGESLWDIPSRMPFQGVLLPRSKDLGLSKAWMSYEWESLAHKLHYRDARIDSYRNTVTAMARCMHSLNVSSASQLTTPEDVTDWMKDQLKPSESVAAALEEKLAAESKFSPSTWAAEYSTANCPKCGRPAFASFRTVGKEQRQLITCTSCNYRSG